MIDSPAVLCRSSLCIGRNCIAVLTASRNSHDSLKGVLRYWRLCPFCPCMHLVCDKIKWYIFTEQQTSSFIEYSS